MSSLQPTGEDAEPQLDAKPHVYEVTVRRHYDACVFVTARSEEEEEARCKAKKRYDDGLLIFEYTGDRDVEDWDVADRGEDGP